MDVNIPRLKICLGILSGRIKNAGALSTNELTLIGWETNQNFPTENQLRLLAEAYYETVFLAVVEELLATQESLTESINGVYQYVNAIQSPPPEV